MAFDDEDESLAHFLESLVLSELSDKQEDLETVGDENEREEEKDGKRLLVEKGEQSEKEEREQHRSDSGPVHRGIETTIFSEIPPELLHHILRFLSSEDLVSSSLVCKFLNIATSDDSLWRRLYHMRWVLPPPKNLRECAWKKLYIQRDGEDMEEIVQTCLSEFKDDCIQMHLAKRSQAPDPSQVNEDRIIVNKTLADQVSMWKSSRGNRVVANHACPGEGCVYYQIRGVFVCEKTLKRLDFGTSR